MSEIMMPSLPTKVVTQANRMALGLLFKRNGVFQEQQMPTSINEERQDEIPLAFV